MATPLYLDDRKQREPEQETPKQTGSARLMESHQQEIEAEIDRARAISRRGEIDGEYVYSEETLDRAVAFMKAHIEWLWRTCGIKAPVPMIGNGPTQSVDLFWQRPSWKLLVNIPAAQDALATFYGDDYGPQKTKGTLDPKKLSTSIVACLMSE
jgi:hypothetical protein